MFYPDPFHAESYLLRAGGTFCHHRLPHKQLAGRGEVGKHLFACFAGILRDNRLDDGAVLIQDVLQRSRGVRGGVPQDVGDVAQPGYDVVAEPGAAHAEEQGVQGAVVDEEFPFVVGIGGALHEFEQLVDLAEVRRLSVQRSPVGGRGLDAEAHREDFCDVAWGGRKDLEAPVFRKLHKSGFL